MKLVLKRMIHAAMDGENSMLPKEIPLGNYICLSFIYTVLFHEEVRGKTKTLAKKSSPNLSFLLRSV